MKLATSILLLLFTSGIISVVIAFVVDMVLLNWPYLYNFLYGIATLFGSMTILVLVCIPKSELTWNMTSISSPDPANAESSTLATTSIVPSPSVARTSVGQQSCPCPYRYYPSPQPLVINFIGSTSTDTNIQVSLD